jgi:hypothetical protein
MRGLDLKPFIPAAQQQEQWTPLAAHLPPEFSAKKREVEAQFLEAQKAYMVSLQENKMAMDEGTTIQKSLNEESQKKKKSVGSELTAIRKRTLARVKRGEITREEALKIMEAEQRKHVRVRGMAKGGQFVTTGPELLYVGEQGPEHVQITPGGAGVQPAQPTQRHDVESTMMRERATTNNTATSLRTDELSSIDAASQDQVNKLIEIEEGIQELVALMKPNNVVGAGEAPRPSTALDTLPVQSPQYGVWKYGKPGGGPSRNVVNDGM